MGFNDTIVVADLFVIKTPTLANFIPKITDIEQKYGEFYYGMAIVDDHCEICSLIIVFVMYLILIHLNTEYHLQI